LHTGFDINLFNCNIITKFSYSWNYGTYRTSAEGKDFPGAVYPSTHGVFPKTEQFSMYIKTRRNIKYGNLQGGIVAAFDVGGLYDNTFGLIAYVSKRIF